MMDTIDETILRELQRNGRLSIRKLAELVYLTAPAVSERVRRLEDAGIITGYTIRVDSQKVQPKLLAYVDVLIKSSHHRHLLQFIEDSSEVRECHRVSGDSCYLLKVETPDQAALDHFLEDLLAYANYRVKMVVSSTTKG
jgi:Lrp/AsnC family transcriptional regulator, leucine-responsive regulatory protein